MRWLVVVVLVGALTACEPKVEADPCATGAVRTWTDVAYGPDPLQRLDLTTRGCRPRPVVVWVHGGGFAIGAKENGMADKVRWAQANGWAIASVDYRLSPAVRHPAHVQDVAGAVGHLVRNAATLGIDPFRIVLAGHSAGAFLVALLGTDPSYLTAAGVDPARVRGVVALDTRYDIAAEIGDDSRSEAMYRNAFGDDPAVWHAASPLTHAGAGDPPILVVTRGTADRKASARAFAARLSDGELLDVSPLTHAGVNDALGRAGDTKVTPATTAFVRGLVTHR